MKFGPRHYVPFLRTKTAEMGALSSLSLAARGGMTPLLDVVEFTPPSPSKAQPLKPGQKPRKQKEPKKEEDHVKAMAARIAGAWQGRCFVDIAWDRPGASHPLPALIDALRGQGIEAVPVTGGGRSSRHYAAVRAVHAKHACGACVRLTSANLGGPSAAATAVLGTVGLKPSEVDLVIDMGSSVNFTPSVLSVAQTGILGMLPTLGQWRTLTVSSGAFPTMLSTVILVAGAFHPISRIDWEAWLATVTGRAVSRKPSFGDYAVDNPAPLPPAPAAPVPNIRYCAKSEWQVIRGLKKGGPAQMHAFCGILKAASFSSGPTFSAGDGWWHTRAGSTPAKIGGGNASQWREAAYSRHLTFVPHQLAKVPGI